MRDVILEINEERRRAPGHFAAKATNARLSAYVLWTASKKDQDDAVEATGYTGAPQIALHEGYLREAALALELILKAVVARRLELGIAMRHITSVRATHDLMSLWRDAELPPLSADDQYRMFVGKTILLWAGRYGAPKSNRDVIREQIERERLVGRSRIDGKIVFRTNPNFDWANVDRLFQIAYETCLALYRASKQ